jgi:hypothetical protein
VFTKLLPSTANAVADVWITIMVGIPAVHIQQPGETLRSICISQTGFRKVVSEFPKDENV